MKRIGLRTLSIELLNL